VNQTIVAQFTIHKYKKVEFKFSPGTCSKLIRVLGLQFFSILTPLHVPTYGRTE